MALEWRIRAIFRDNLPASVLQTYTSLFGGTLMSAASVDWYGAEVGVGGGDKQWEAYAAAKVRLSRLAGYGVHLL